MAESLKGSFRYPLYRISCCVVDNGLAVDVFALPACCNDLQGIVVYAVDFGVHPYPVLLTAV